MRSKILALAATLAVGLALTHATPAHAAHVLQGIDFPGTVDEFYSPFNGPATITIAVDAGDADATFGVRLRPLGGATIHSDSFFVNNGDADGTVTFQFTWPALSVSTPRQYEVAVYRSGALVGPPESFFLHPRLVAITGINPNPFLPWIDDDIKDEAHVHFSLEADADAEARVFKAKSGGGCCGPLVRDETLMNLTAGANTWDWDGQGEGAYAGFQPKGDYFVKIWADDGVRSPALSSAKKVSIARTYMKTEKKSKSATAYHHIGPVTSYLRGGNCFATDAQTDLWITCLHAKFTIYWRWGLPAGSKITKVSFTFIPVSGDICKFTKGHSTTESWMRAGTESGQVRCRVDLARITYSTPTPS
jgi:hypothetical protein